MIFDPAEAAASLLILASKLLVGFLKADNFLAVLGVFLIFPVVSVLDAGLLVGGEFGLDLEALVGDVGLDLDLGTMAVGEVGRDLGCLEITTDCDLARTNEVVSGFLFCFEAVDAEMDLKWKN